VQCLLKISISFIHSFIQYVCILFSVMFLDIFFRHTFSRLAQGWNSRLVIDNRWRYSLIFFYRLSICFLCSVMALFSTFLLSNIDLFLYFYFIEYRFVTTFSLSISNSALTLKHNNVFGLTK